MNDKAYKRKRISDKINEMKDSNNLTMANLPETYFLRKHLYKSSLDHIYYSNSLEDEVSYKATDHAATDHRPIILELKKRTSKRARPEVKLVEKRCFKEFSQKAFNKDLKAQAWEDLANINSVDEMVDIYTNLVEEVLNKHAPVELVKQYKH